MSLVTTATLCCGESARLKQSTNAVLPLPTGPATPTRNARIGFRLKQEIALSQRQHAGRFARQKFAVCPDFIGFGIDFELGGCGVVDHVLLSDAAAILHCDGTFSKTYSCRNSGL